MHSVSSFKLLTEVLMEVWAKYDSIWCVQTSKRMTPAAHRRGGGGKQSLIKQTSPRLHTTDSVCVPHAGTKKHFNNVCFPSFLHLKPQEFPAYVRASPVPFTNGSPRTYRNSVPSIISPDAGRGVTRRRW